MLPADVAKPQALGQTLSQHNDTSGAALQRYLGRHLVTTTIPLAEPWQRDLADTSADTGTMHNNGLLVSRG